MAADDPRQGAFPSTHASLVALAAHPDAPGWQAAWERFFAGYWRPLYAYLRRTGSQPDDALDLLQDLFLAGAKGDLLARFDPARGRLRTYLLTCLTNLRRKAQRRERARPDRHTLGWLGGEDPEQGGAGREPRAADEAERFEREWLRCVRERAVAGAVQRLSRAGDPQALKVLHEWVLAAERPPAEAFAADLGLTPGALYTRASRLRRALVGEVERAVRWLEEDPQRWARERDAVLALLRGAS